MFGRLKISCIVLMRLIINLLIINGLENLEKSGNFIPRLLTTLIMIALAAVLAVSRNAHY